jgi:hypothetical protein
MGRNYKQLSIEERTMIQTQLEMGIKPAAIARELGRSGSALVRATAGVRATPCPIGARYRGARNPVISFVSEGQASCSPASRQTLAE